MRLAEKTVVITGAAGGIGSAVAALLSSHGASVILLDLDENKGQALVRDISREGRQAYYLHCDVTSESDWKHAVDFALEKTGKIDVLVNNAGINIRKPIEEMSIDEWSTMMLVNTGSVFLGTKYVIPVMKKQGGGCIINMSSICGLIGHRYTPEAYTASKGAVTLLTKSVASRYAKFGIRANSIHPSTVDTPFVQQLFKDPEKKKERLDEVPLGRLASTDDVAACVLFIASDQASFINGASVPVDGGLTAC